MNRRVVSNIFICGVSFLAGITTYKMIRRKNNENRLKEVEDYSQRKYIDLTEINSKQEEKIKELEKNLEYLKKRLA